MEKNELWSINKFYSWNKQIEFDQNKIVLKLNKMHIDLDFGSNYM